MAAFNLAIKQLSGPAAIIGITF